MLPGKPGLGLLPKPPVLFAGALFGFAKVLELNNPAGAALNEVGAGLLKPELKAGGLDGELENSEGLAEKPGFANEDPAVGPGAPPEKPVPNRAVG